MNGTNEDNNNEVCESEEGGVEVDDQFLGTPLQRFYTGQRILITGGTGFLGKILTEKLLRSCPDISTIYLLVRSKKGKTALNRIEEMFEERIFERLKNQVPNFSKKIVGVIGNCDAEGLALSEEDRELVIRDVSIVFHLAATVRFDEELKVATATNVRSTSSILDLCKRMKNLKSFVHVSTVYANCHENQIGERFYDYPIAPGELLALADVLPGEDLDRVTHKYVQRWPNTYTFTKAIAEALVRDRSADLPVGIFRPAIVVSTANEPFPGWIDNLYGPTGMVAAGATGILKVVLCGTSITANIVPVDSTVNALIASAWDISSQTERRDKSMLIYNYVSSVEAPITWGEFCQLNKTYVRQYPLSSSMWHHSFVVVGSKILYCILILFIHFLPALLIDVAGLCVSRKPRLWKVYGKIHKFSSAISFFSLNEFDISNDNVQAMWRRLGDKDQQLFNFNMIGFDWKNYCRLYVLGIRTYMFNESLDNLKSCRIRANRLYWLHQAVKLFLLLVAAWIVWKIFVVVF